MVNLDSHRWALVVAHPGHELRAFHFVERAKPIVSVLTDGSGSHGVSRIAETARLLAEVGATVGAAFGNLTDRAAYAHLMEGRPEVFVETAAALADSFIVRGITAVVTDAAEEYNPVHDVCRVLAESAVKRCGAAAPILFEVDLIRHPAGSGDGLRLNLDDNAFERKLDAVRRYSPLAGEATAAFDHFGVEAFRTEFFRPAGEVHLPPAAYVPHYERVGDERVREGRYATVLRYGQHVRPVLEALLTAGHGERDAAAISPLH